MPRDEILYWSEELSKYVQEDNIWWSRIKRLIYFLEEEIIDKGAYGS